MLGQYAPTMLRRRITLLGSNVTIAGHNHLFGAQVRTSRFAAVCAGTNIFSKGHIQLTYGQKHEYFKFTISDKRSASRRHSKVTSTPSCTKRSMWDV